MPHFKPLAPTNFKFRILSRRNNVKAHISSIDFLKVFKFRNFWLKFTFEINFVFVFPQYFSEISKFAENLRKVNATAWAHTAPDPVNFKLNFKNILENYKFLNFCKKIYFSKFTIGKIAHISSTHF